MRRINRMKEITILFACSFIIMGLMGCRSNVRTQTGDDLKNTEIQEEPLKIIAHYESTSMRKAMKELVEDYEQMNNGKSVELEFIPLDQYRRELSVRMENGELGDIIICENSVMPTLINMGILCDISEDVDNANLLGNYNINLWSNTRSNGKIYGIPLLSDPYVMYYNKDIFAYRELTLPETWEEFAVTAQNVNMKNVGTYALGFGVRQSEEMANIYLQLLYSMGGNLRAVNDENGMKVFELLERFRDDELISPDCINWNEIDACEMFGKREVAIMFNKLSAYTQLMEKKLDFEVGLAAMPYEKKETDLFFGDNAGITVDADYGGALDFIEYLSSKEAVRKLSDLTNTIPVRLDVGYENENPFLQDYAKRQREAGIAKGSYNRWFNISDTIAKGVFDILTQESLDIQVIADEVQDKVRISIIEN